MEIKVREVVQAGDTFLMRFTCPSCWRGDLRGYPAEGCLHCGADWGKAVFKLPRTRSGRRLLVGTKRKTLYLGKRKIQTLMEIQERACAYCDCSLDDPTIEYHVDHIVPVSVGGTNSINNLVIACKTCNLVAQDFVFPTLMAKRVYIQDRRRVKERNTYVPRATETGQELIQ